VTSTLGIYVMNADGSRQRRLTPNEVGSGGPAGPAWSPDGRKITFIGQGLGAGIGVYVINADGSGLRNLNRTRISTSAPSGRSTVGRSPS
jgi:Tol biopolymer transport system component